MFHAGKSADFAYITADVRVIASTGVARIESISAA
jgi:hypothetical protein